jgi:nucleoid DNA-binding protein
MASLNDVAREAGANPIKCGSCFKSNDTSKVLSALFGVILKRVAAGEVVRIAGFGVFRARKFKGRTLHSPILETGEISFPDSLVLRFHQSVVAKRRLNEFASHLEGKKSKKAAKKAAKKATKKGEE